MNELENSKVVYNKKQSRMTIDEIEKLKFLSVQQAADVAGGGRRVIYNWIAEGRIPAARVGNAYMIPTVAFLKYLEDLAAENLIKR
ncbi:helix-turn-helix domain-containing protein [Acidaminobacter hydrogenoformans]|uniref:DNA binding domain-containing protein, excisionase family n=1 Tax=Acidaminobacter hydrogenoformans DSM 2784 TaxID=1120920 RepID=A0A1G5S7A6_9FIRM|nr:helix-turn-helix domain-containing protein [Acidaminobacter hydrogenoformans]SCZ82098.1 DNA binding domain-containing protein, excisionase family [Acidaminobacter hydrogenoformans DSM 2784]